MSFASAQGDRSGVRPEVLQVPSGPGSIEGLGEAFEPNPNTGTSSYSVDISVPPGVAGFVPSIALRYSSGAGNGELGLGWTLGLPMVQRGTDRGLPRYDASDVIVLRGMEGRGAEDLVQMPDGSWRFRIEGAFVRGRHQADGSWEFRNRSGIRFLFGTTPTSTVTGSGSRVFAWHLTAQIDTHGNTIRYEYERDATGRPYLSAIVYNDFSPAVRNEVRFEYESRPDALTSYLSTFAVTTARRLRRIAVLHGGAPVRTYDLAYVMGNGVSRIASVTMTGRDGVTKLPTLSLEYAQLNTNAMSVVTMADGPARALGATTELDDVDGDALPDLLVMDPALDGGTYSYYPNLDGSSWGARQLMTNTPSVWLASQDVQLADMDGDGASDVVARVSSAADGFRYYPGGDATTFGARVTITPNPSFGFEDPDVRLVDQNHDRLTDWMRIDPTTGAVFVAYNQGGGTFAAAVSLPRVDPSQVVSFSAGAQFADCNGDGLEDIVLLRSQSFRCWPGTGFGRFAAPLSYPGAPTLSNGELAEAKVRDVNGDGLADVIHVGISQVRFWLNLGGASLAQAQTITGTPSRGINTVVRVADMNGNGSADIVWVDPTVVGAPWRYLDLLADGSPGLLTRIDNGLGQVVSIEYAGIGVMRGWARSTSTSWTHRSSLGQTVVSRVRTDDGLGNVQEQRLRYASALFDGRTREARGFESAEVESVGEDDLRTLVERHEFDLGVEDEATRALRVSIVRRRRGEAGFIDRAAFERIVRTVAVDANGAPLRFAFESAQMLEVLEHGEVGVTLRREWDYDGFGNLVRDANLGRYDGVDPAFGEDESIREWDYAVNEPTWVVSAVASERVRDSSGRLLAEKRTYYDGAALVGLPLGTVTRGLPSRVEQLVRPGEYVTAQRSEYDAHGNLVRRIDARGAELQVAWDAESNTHAVRETRTTGQGSLTWHAEYDRASGRILAVTHPSGGRMRFAYDALERVSSVRFPDDADDRPSRQYEYAFGNPLSYVRETIALDGDLGTDTYSYFDGFGRRRGSLAQAKDSKWVVTELVDYDRRGEVSFVANAFYASSPVLPIGASTVGVHTVHDATGRISVRRHADGSVERFEYRPLEDVLFDANDEDPASAHFDTPSRVVRDGLGRTIAVVEIEQGRETTSRFGYDALNNVTFMVDAMGRERHYEYDARSLRTAVHDPNAGDWSIEYDAAGDVVPPCVRIVAASTV